MNDKAEFARDLEVRLPGSHSIDRPCTNMVEDENQLLKVFF